MGSSQRLVGKVALITGGSRGIGAMTAKLFVEHGAQVVIADVLDELGSQLAEEIGAAFVHCDVRCEKDIENAVSFAVKTYGGLHVLFSNAGVAAPKQSFLDLDLSSFDETMAVNVRGVAATIKHAARVMVANKTNGSIICQASIASVLGGITPHSYTVSKEAVLGLMKSACSEMGAYGIRINAISPSGLSTPLTCHYMGGPQGVRDYFGPLENLKGIELDEGHVANAALFLASDESAYISGHNLVVDGGLTVVKQGFDDNSAPWSS